MKRVVAVVLVMVLAAPSFAQEWGENVKKMSREQVERVEVNLVLALESDIPGMVCSAAQTARDVRCLRSDYSFSRLIIPLMRVVKNEYYCQSSRVLAALALHELRSSRGDFAIKRTAQFTDSKMMKHVCSWLAYYRLVEQKPELAQKVLISPLLTAN